MESIVNPNDIHGLLKAIGLKKKEAKQTKEKNELTMKSSPNPK